MEILKSTRKIFKDKTNIAILIVLLLVCAYTVVVRFINLGVLSYWDNDWQTFLGTSGILESGYPKIPSGAFFYQSIAHFYLTVIPVIIGGANEFTLRFPSALFGSLIIPLMFIFIRDLLNNKYIALLSSIIIAISIWQIEFSREIGFYSEFQFFYLLSIYLFYRGFFKGEKGFKIAAPVFIILTIFINELGLTLIFLYLPLLIYKRFKGFFKKDIIISFFLVSAVIAGQQILKKILWKAGLIFSPGIINPNAQNFVSEGMPDYFSSYTSFFHRIFGSLFPGMYYVVFFGMIIILLYLFIPGIRSEDEHYINIYSGANYSIKLPFNLFFLYFIFYSNTVYNGFVQIPSHQSYIYHIHPIFIALYCCVIFNIGILASNYFDNAVAYRNKIKKQEKSDKYPLYLKRSVLFITVAMVFFLTVNWVNPVSNFMIVNRKNGETVVNGFKPDNTPGYHQDIRTPGNYIHEHKGSGDLVITGDILGTYGYIKEADFWLNKADTKNWQVYKKDDGKYYDIIFGIPIIKDIYQLYDVLNNNPSRNIWIITSGPEISRDQMGPAVAGFINSQEKYKISTGTDGTWSAYLFPKTDKAGRDFSFIPEKENIINIKIPADNPFIIGFGNNKNKPYLQYGWSQIESQGTWADREYSFLFLNFEEKEDYLITLDAMALSEPEREQEMNIIFNDTEIGQIVFDEPDLNQYSFKIKKELIETESYNTIKFSYKYQYNPLSMGISADTRDLSVFFQKITVEEAK